MPASSAKTSVTNNQLSIERFVPAPPAAIFDLLADPDRHAEIDGSGSVQKSRGGARRLALGDSFGMDMKLGIAYSTKNVVVEYEENRVIAWQTLAAAPLDKIATGRIWRYELEPRDGGTLVRETWDLRSEAALSRPLVKLVMTDSTRGNIEKTLERIERVVTAG